MGKIFSGPKAPSTQFVAQNPVSVAATSSVEAVDSVDTTTTDNDTSTDTQAISSALRQESLLRRSRGRLGTITSGFTGFLDSVGDTVSSARKTLLGE